jgi:hypothetical protein
VGSARAEIEARLDATLRAAGVVNPAESADKQGWRHIAVGPVNAQVAIIEAEQSLYLRAIVPVMQLPSDLDLILPLMRDLLERDFAQAGPARLAIDGLYVTSAFVLRASEMSEQDMRTAMDYAISVAGESAQPLLERYGGTSKGTSNATARVPDNSRGAVEKAPMELMRPQLSTEEAWHRFAEALSIALADLDEDEYLVVSRKNTNYYVQLMDQGSFGVRAEAVSSSYLTDDELLSDESKARLVELGWTAPTHPPSDEYDEQGRHKTEGAPNFYLDLAKPTAYPELADLMVTTLREVYGAGHPGGLEYNAASTNGMSIRFPHLGIRRKRSR